jgi:hypothetical protein
MQVCVIYVGKGDTEAVTFAYVAHLVFFLEMFGFEPRELPYQACSATILATHLPNLATHLPNLATHLHSFSFGLHSRLQDLYWRFA